MNKPYFLYFQPLGGHRWGFWRAYKTERSATEAGRDLLANRFIGIATRFRIVNDGHSSVFE